MALPLPTVQQLGGLHVMLRAEATTLNGLITVCRHLMVLCGPPAVCFSPSSLSGEAAGGKQRKKGIKPAGKAKSGRCSGLGVPVIATANDAYAPCLRPLRDVAAIYHFKPPGPDRLMARLAAVTAAERLAMDRQVSTLSASDAWC